MRALRTGQSTQDLHFKHESELHMSASAGKGTRAACVTGEHATIEPLMHIKTFDLLYNMSTLTYISLWQGVPVFLALNRPLKLNFRQIRIKLINKFIFVHIITIFQ